MAFEGYRREKDRKEILSVRHCILMEGTEKISGFEGSQIFFPRKKYRYSRLPHTLPILSLIQRVNYALIALVHLNNI
jgi:hypothetical protein